MKLNHEICIYINFTFKERPVTRHDGGKLTIKRKTHMSRPNSG